LHARVTASSTAASPVGKCSVSCDEVSVVMGA
jgi:hypothetical protein